MSAARSTTCSRPRPASTMENPASETQSAFFLRSYTVRLSLNSLRCTSSGSAASPGQKICNRIHSLVRHGTEHVLGPLGRPLSPMNS